MKTIDWAKWSAIAEIFSAIAILVTLGYLATQTRYLALQTEQNTAALIAGNRQAFLAEELDWFYVFVEQDAAELDSIFGLPRPDNPDNRYEPNAFLRFQTFTVAFFRMRETLWLNHVDGAVDVDQWEAYRGVLVSMLETSENIRASWDFYSSGMAPGFVAEIEAQLAD